MLAGGTSRRLRTEGTVPSDVLPGGVLTPGMDKTEVVLRGRTLLEHVLDGCAGAAQIAVVGPVRPLCLPAGPGGRERVRWCRESPAGAGPLAAVAAGASATGERPAPVVVVLGGDMPFVGGAVAPLLAALERGRRADPDLDAVALARAGGGHHPLCLAVRRTALTAALTRLGDPTGRPLRLLLAHLRLGAVADAGDWALDVDDGADLLAALARFATGSPVLPR